MRLLPLLIAISIVSGYNLVVDVHNRLIARFVDSYGDVVRHALINLPPLDGEGHQRLTRVHLYDASVEGALPEIHFYAKPEQIKLNSINFTVVGRVSQKLVIIQQTSQFRATVQNVTFELDSVRAISYSGLPYLHEGIKCRARFFSDPQIELDKGKKIIFSPLLLYRLKQTLRTRIEEVVCVSLLEQLDAYIKAALQSTHLRMKLPSGQDSIFDFYLAGDPQLTSSGVRTRHAGIALSNSPRNHSSFRAYNQTSEHDLVYHIHEQLIAEAANAVCAAGHFDGSFELPPLGLRLNVTCSGFPTASLAQFKTSHQVSLFLPLFYTLIEAGSPRPAIPIEKRIYLTVYISPHAELSFRLQSEVLAEPAQLRPFSTSVARHLSQAIRDRMLLPLPILRGTQFSVDEKQEEDDRIILAGALE